MAQTIKLRRSSTAGAVPTIAQLALGEVAINTADGKLFIKKNDGTESIVEIGAGAAVASSPVKFDDISGSFNGSNTTFNITVSSSAYTPGDVLTTIVSLNGVTQEPNTSYSISGSQITFTDPPGSNDEFYGIDLSTIISQYFGAGTEASPSITFVGDTDTGIYKPAANTLGFSCNGDEKLRIDSSGNIGINTIAPDVELHIKEEAPKLRLETSGPLSTLDGTEEIARIEWEGTNSTNSTVAASIRARQAGTWSNIQQWNAPTALEFYTQDNSGSEITTPRLTIDDAGNVGIGTTSPGSILHTAANDPEIRIQDLNSATANSSDARLSFYHSAGTKTAEIGYTATNNSNSLKFRSTVATGLALGTDNTDALYIDSSQKVGIGETNPAAGLDVKVDTNPVLAIDRGSANTANFNLYYNGTLGGQVSAANSEFQISAVGATAPMSFFTNGGERLRIDSSGNVGIGTTSPGRTLDVAGSIRSGGSTNPFLALADGTTEAYFEIASSVTRVSSGTSQPLAFRIGSSEAARIDSSGRLLVGRSSSLNVSSFENHLQVNGTTASSSSISAGRFSNDASAPLLLLHKSRGTDVDTNTILQGNDIIGRIAFYGADGTDYEEAAHIQCQVDGQVATSGDTTDMPGRLVFSTTPDGGHDAVERMRIDSSGNVQVTGSVGNTILKSSGAEVEFTRADGSFLTASNASGFLGFQTGGTNERMRIDSSGRLLVGTTTARANFYNGSFSAALQLEGTETNRRLSITGADEASVVILARQKSGSTGGNTILANGDNIGVLTFQGNDGSEFVEAASITAQVDATPGANDMPGRLVFSTTADGASSLTERMRIGSAGQIGIGGANYGTSGQVLTSNGSSSAPSWQDAGGGSGFDSGTAMLFQQTAAPTGWTKSTTHNNKALRVVSGTAGSGGSSNFDSVFGSSVSTNAHTLTTSQIPSHSHTIPVETQPTTNPFFYGDIYYSQGDYRYPSTITANSTGGGGSHSHTMSMDVAYVDTIIATKD